MFFEIKNADIGYGKSLFSGITLTVDKGEVIAIVGINGVGKSTFLKSVAGIIPFLNGEVLVDGQKVSGFSRNKLSKIIGFSSVNNINVSNLTVRDLIALGRIPHTSLIGNFSEKDVSAIDEAIEKTGLLNLQNKEITKISDGERQRAFIARLVAQQTEILLFDEPTAFLDVAGKYKIVSLFRQIAACNSKIVVFSTHDLKIAIQNADKIWLFNNGEIIDNSPEDLILNRTFENLFSDSKLNFNNFTADFDVSIQELGLVKITNESTDDIRLNWTIKALNRIGYVSDNKAEKVVVVRPDYWFLESNGQKERYSSLYKLLKNIRHDKKN
ncbi:MAG: ABC transporter ATP-binding protein [Bacteroidales bacterium]|nr:ABC transporter ATP-binding protein [Bacteroidales bacterium]